MNVKLLTKNHLEFLSLKGGCISLSESRHVKMRHCWKSHVTAHILWTLFSSLGDIFWLEMRWHKPQTWVQENHWYVVINIGINLWLPLCKLICICVSEWVCGCVCNIISLELLVCNEFLDQWLGTDLGHYIFSNKNQFYMMIQSWQRVIGE